MIDSLFLNFPLVDMTVPIDGELPIQANTTTPIGTIINEPGGPANIFIAARRVGCNILPVGAVGDDYYGRFVLDAYAREGIDTSYLTVHPGLETRKVIVLVDRKGRHAYISMLDGDFECPEDISALLTQSRSLCVSGYMLLDGIAGGKLVELARLAHSQGKAVFFDPGPLIPQIRPEWMERMLASSAAVILNDEEAELLSGLKGVENCAKAIAGRTGGWVVVKAGGKGCYIVEGGEGNWYPGFHVEMVDTTGAGDTFWGAFIHAFLSGWDKETVALFCNAMGATMVSKQGSGSQAPTFEELVATLEKGGFPIPEAAKRSRSFGSLTLRRGSEQGVDKNK